MDDRLAALEREFRQALAAAAGNPAAVEELRVRFLGKKGGLNVLLRELGRMDASQRARVGSALNEAKGRIEAALAEAKEAAAGEAREAALARERIDVTLPSRRPPRGSLHPVTQTRRELERIFTSMGFTVETGPEVEDDFHNFEALNLPPGHPARDASDTFYLEGGLLLRTHTSPVQIRTMLARKPPIRMICPGRVYRKDLDATHLPMFHQLEALVVDEGTSLADLKGTCAAVWSRFFGDDVAIRLRPGYFPFVEPGCEFDISCRMCDGRGCRICKETGWIELGGAGMVHPAVFEAVGIDPERWTGFAFGLGIDRIAMMRYGIDDLRLMIDNDVRFLRQFPS
ncbi:MAG TPA: phenylalanine--tRNA ligase subunit alpha [Candidatus Polarisedimenticolaceae bacterium]|nr:phenylalanine--tRNA ligase subunit alpha [Candidatus Polarisedimenticolaceae bacterium]